MIKIGQIYKAVDSTYKNDIVKVIEIIKKGYNQKIKVEIINSVTDTDDIGKNYDYDINQFKDNFKLVVTLSLNQEKDI